MRIIADIGAYNMLLTARPPSRPVMAARGLRFQMGL